MSGGGGGERSSLSNLKAELRNLKEENMLSISQNTQLALANSHLQASLSHSITNIQAFKFGANLILENDRKTCFYVYTGLPTYKVFCTLFDLLHPYHSFLQFSLPNIDHFFATLVYLHLHTPVEDLATQLQISQPNVSCMFHSWIETMYHNLQPLVTWPDTETLRQNEWVLCSCSLHVITAAVSISLWKIARQKVHAPYNRSHSNPILECTRREDLQPVKVILATSYSPL